MTRLLMILAALLVLLAVACDDATVPGIDYQCCERDDLADDFESTVWATYLAQQEQPYECEVGSCDELGYSYCCCTREDFDVDDPNQDWEEEDFDTLDKHCGFHCDPNNVGVSCRLDQDVDDVSDPVDNCPLVANQGQEDTDDDGVGDACE